VLADQVKLALLPEPVFVPLPESGIATLPAFEALVVIAIVPAELVVLFGEN
jgi:hypothetical protein